MAPAAIRVAAGLVVVATLLGAYSGGEDVVEPFEVDGRAVTVTVDEGAVSGEFPAALVFPDSDPLRTITERPDDGAPLEGIPLLMLLLETDASEAEVMEWYEKVFRLAGERFEGSDVPAMRSFTWGRFSGSLLVAENALNDRRTRIIQVALYDPPTFPPVSRLNEVLLGGPGRIEGPDGQVIFPSPTDSSSQSEQTTDRR